MIQLLSMRHIKCHLSLSIMVARVDHDPLRSPTTIIPRRKHWRRADPMALERGEDIFANLPARAVAQVKDILGMRLGRAREADFDL